MFTAPGSPLLRRLSAVGLLVTLVALGACGGSESGAGVASLDNNASKDTTKDTASSKDAEADLQKWVECMRDHGIDMPDPTTDADGNLTLRPPGGGDVGPSTDAQSGSDQPEPIDRDAMDAAREECGDPPEGAMGGFDRGNSQEFQDSALKFAQCMRDNGVDMPDPVFDEPSAANGDRPQGGPRLFGGGGIDPDDPVVAKAMDACRDIMPGPGGGTVGGGGDAPTSGGSSATGA